MSNVLALNLCYGVYVKLISLHMLLLSVFLVAPDTRRLANIFLFNRTVDRAQPVPLSNRSWVNRTAVISPPGRTRPVDFFAVLIPGSRNGAIGALGHCADAGNLGCR